MGAPTLVVVEAVRKHAFEVSFVNNDRVIEKLATDTLDQPFDIRVLPRWARSSEDLTDIKPARTTSERFAIDCVSIPHQIPGGGVEGEGFVELLRGPLGRRMPGHVEVHDVTPTLGEHCVVTDNAWVENFRT